ncbi:MAG: tetratricopeptide repeat protein [Planctomycetes bacterium]|nr:tetratricopeptide repeat protein [Planctomycetota bacterium]
MTEFLTTENIIEIFEKEKSSLHSLYGLKAAVHAALDNRKAIETLIKDIDKNQLKFSSENITATRKGIGLWATDNIKGAIETFEKAHSSKESSFFAGICRLESGEPEKALHLLNKVYEMDSISQDENEYLLVVSALAESHTTSGKPDKALELLKKHQSKLNKSAEFHYQLGLAYDMQNYHPEAETEYKTSLKIEVDYPKALFRIAYKHDLYGNEEEAMRLYETLTNIKPPYVNAFLNLGTIYDDLQEYDKAEYCFKTVLDSIPGHKKAALFLKDVIASKNMFYDEDAKKKDEQVKKLMSITLTDFPLSARSKNCLSKLEVFTLGDLVRKTEDEIRSCKNVGETSIKEIKELLMQKGLALAESAEAAMSMEHAAGLASPQELLSKSIDEIDWSPRCKKAIKKLKMTTIADIVSKSEQELLGCQNFGIVSLDEVKLKLTKVGLSLRKQ